jgi:putative FmdB family regulatory protein
MPFYEYECQACGKYLETLQKLSEPPLTDCPECGKPELKKLVSAAGFRLKGAGWYETDFKSKDKKKNLHDGTGDKTGGDKSSGGKGGKGGEAKPDTAVKADKPAVEKPVPKKASTDD